MNRRQFKNREGKYFSNTLGHFVLDYISNCEHYYVYTNGIVQCRYKKIYEEDLMSYYFLPKNEWLKNKFLDKKNKFISFDAIKSLLNHENSFVRSRI